MVPPAMSEVRRAHGRADATCPPEDTAPGTAPPGRRDPGGGGRLPPEGRAVRGRAPGPNVWAAAILQGRVSGGTPGAPRCDAGATHVRRGVRAPDRIHEGARVVQPPIHG